MGIFGLIVAAVNLLAPASGETVVLLPECQRAVLAKESREERLAVMDLKTEDWRCAKPVVFRWQVTEGEKGPWEIRIGKKPDLSDARMWLMRDADVVREAGQGDASGPVTVTRHDFPYFNPEIATVYYWQVKSNVTCGNFGHGRTCACKNRKPSVASPVGSFQTEDLAPRWISIIGKTKNFRDLGGRIGLGGRRVRQGLVFRSQGLNDNSVDGVVKGRNRLTVSDVEYLTETLGIRTDLDVRGKGETAGLNGVSPLGASVRYVSRPSMSYAGIFTDEGKRIMAENFREFLDEKHYPIIFHCMAGADRTGALGYVLNGVLGVSRKELETDWESTYYPKIPYRNKKGEIPWNSERHFEDGFRAYGDENSSWNDRIVLYVKSCGVTDEEIATFRSIMLTER